MEQGEGKEPQTIHSLPITDNVPESLGCHGLGKNHEGGAKLS